MVGVQCLAVTDVGNHRENNEDRYLIDTSLGLYAVCDGMGGHAAGEIASEKALEFAADHIRARKALLDGAPHTAEGYLGVLHLAEDALRTANGRLHELSVSDTQYAGMGTTMTMLLVVGNKGVMAHVGDSRLYLLRKKNVFLLSTDHTLANELVRVGVMSEKDAQHLGYDHVLTRSVGQQARLDVESLVFDLLQDDVCLICSDGLSQYFPSFGEIASLLGQNDFQDIPGRLVELAKSRGGTDNITAIVLRVASVVPNSGRDFEADSPSSAARPDGRELPRGPDSP